MRKTDKKIENNIRKALTNVCELASSWNIGFKWLTHTVNYENFERSFHVMCVFENKEVLLSFLTSESKQTLIGLIETELKQVDVMFKPSNQNITFTIEPTKFH